MKHFNLQVFLDKFYRNLIKDLLLKKIWVCLMFIYGMNKYSSLQICFLFGINFYLVNKFLEISDWTNIYLYIKKKFNFFLYDLKMSNLKNIKFIRSYRGWRHIFNLPVRGQRSHTNARTRKKFNIY